MLNETKLALRIKTNVYDGEIARLIEAAVGDLGIVDVDAAGVSFIISATTTGETVTDNSTITDQLLIRAIIISSAVPRRYKSAQRVFIVPPTLMNSVVSSSR